MNLSSFIFNKIFTALLAATHEERKAPYPHPPWSQDMQLCTACGDCITACPAQILILEQGLPRMDFHLGACSFCGACAKACVHGALYFDEHKAPWTLRAAISSTCLGSLCRSCEEACTAEALRLPSVAAQRPEILTEQCNGCGACAAICPVGAISFTSLSQEKKENI